MPVAFGGLLNVSDGSGNMSAERFLREAYAAGAKGEMDAIAIHPYSYLYPGSPSSTDSPYRQMLAGVRRARDEAGDHSTPLWITETGYRTGPQETKGVTPEVQAKWLTETVRLALAEPDVEMVLLHCLVDRAGDPNDPEVGFGVVRSDLEPKPALAALAAITGVPRITLSVTRRRLSARQRRLPALRVTLSEPADVTFVIERAANRRRATGLRYRTAQRFGRGLGGGVSMVHLPRKGLLRRVRRLRPGWYRVSVRATDRTGEHSAVGVGRFRVVR
jgi:hypothetical protein